jgi:hypothetical protein
MNHADAQARLEEYFDGPLPPEAHREIEAHLIDCTCCRDDLSSLGALLDTVAELQERRVDPPRDLWPEIAARIAVGPRGEAEQAGVPARRGARSAEAGGWGLFRAFGGGRRIPWPWLAAATGLAVVAVVALFLLPRGDTMARELAALDAQVKSSRQDVRPAGSAGIADSTAAVRSWRVFDQSLGVLDRAIKDSRAALARDPGNPILQRSLLAAYQKQLELIRWANRVVRQG